MDSKSNFQIPSGYERGVRFGANWTMVTSPYLILYIILVFSVSNPDNAGIMPATLEYAGGSPIAYRALVLLDGLSHVLGFVTFVTVYAILREAFPVRASLILVGSAWQMLIGFTKGLMASTVFTQLGSAYLAGDTMLRTTLLSVANVAEGLRSALERMDSLGVLFVVALVSLLPQSVNLPRLVRWLGLVIALGLLGPDPSFLLVILFSPFWLFL